MTRVDEIYDDLELIIAEHKAFRRVVDENTELKSAFEDIRSEIIMYKADCDLSLSENDDTCRRCGNNVFGSILRIIDKHDPAKAGKESN